MINSPPKWQLDRSRRLETHMPLLAFPIAPPYREKRPCRSDSGPWVGRGAPKSSAKLTADAIHEKHQQLLEEVRLVGYRYLKPPGVTRTLRTIQEDEANAQSESNLPASVSSDLEGEEDEASYFESIQMRTEDIAMDEDELDDEEAPDFSLPALNASFPTLYHHHHHQS